MVATSRSDLQRLLVELLDDPRELKRWLDLADKAVAADFAREILALANHGGGTVVFGFADEPTGWRPTGACPYAAELYSQDAINNLCRQEAGFLAAECRVQGGEISNWLSQSRALCPLTLSPRRLDVLACSRISSAKRPPGLPARVPAWL